VIDTIGVEFGVAVPFVPRALEVDGNLILEGDQASCKCQRSSAFLIRLRAVPASGVSLSNPPDAAFLALGLAQCAALEAGEGLTAVLILPDGVGSHAAMRPPEA
jgi:hypothetical protein